MSISGFRETQFRGEPHYKKLSLGGGDHTIVTQFRGEPHYEKLSLGGDHTIVIQFRGNHTMRNSV